MIIIIDQNLSWKMKYAIFFGIEMDHSILARRRNFELVNMKKRTIEFVDFNVPADHNVKSKESEKQEKYQDSSIKPKSHRI